MLGGKKNHLNFLKQRDQNQQHCYDFPAENLGWKKFGNAPVYGDSETGTVFDPYVLLHEGRFLMIGSERKTGSLILLSSDNGIKWEKMSTLLCAKPKTWEHIVNRGCMLMVDGIWHLWYTGQNNGVAKIGHLSSTGFRAFTRGKDNQPVLEATMPQEGVSVMNPCVLWDAEGKIFRMWYAAGENYEPDRLFYAESTDGIHWKKREDPILTKLDSHEWEKYKVGGCDVKQLEDGSFIMYYIGYQNMDVARICYAFSNDGIHWERSDMNIAIAPSEGSWDRHATYKPTFFQYKNKQYLWYNGRFATKEYIGLASREIKYDKI